MLKREHVGFVEKTVGDDSQLPAGSVKIHAEVRLTCEGYVSAREVWAARLDSVKEMKDVLVSKLWNEVYRELDDELSKARDEVLCATGNPTTAPEKVFEVFSRLRKLIRWEKP